MKMQESAQDYLESILILSKKQDVVRATDVCNYSDMQERRFPSL